MCRGVGRSGGSENLGKSRSWGGRNKIFLGQAASTAKRFMQAGIINALIYLKTCFGIQMKAPILASAVLCSINPWRAAQKKKSIHI